MQIDYDPEADAVYIRLRAGEAENTVEVDRYIFVDMDKDDIPIGIEILFARKLFAQDDLTSVTVNISHPQNRGRETLVSI